MSLAADALQPFILNGLPRLNGRPSGNTLPNLIGRQRTIGFDLEFDDLEKAICADFRESSQVLDAIASESSRFAAAAFQTAASISEDILKKETIAWSLIRIYYAAFYAGHALIRLVGESCSHLDREHILRISELGRAVGKQPNFKLESGTYRCELNSAAAAIRCTNLRGSAAGDHAAFWNLLGLKLKTISAEMLKGPLPQAEAQIVFSKIDALQTSIRSYAAPQHSQLSIVRNDIQYRHHFGVWLPCSVKRHERERFDRLAKQWTRDPMDVDLAPPTGDKLGEFVGSCSFIISLCRALVLRIDSRAVVSGRSFMSYGPVAILKESNNA